MNRDHFETGIDMVQRTPEFTFGARFRSAQNRQAPSVSAGSVYLPARRATRRGHVNCGVGICTHEARVKSALRLDVVGHGPPERVEVRLEERIAPRFGGPAQLVELGSVRALVGQAGDDTIV